jgi:hypothetical protein
MLQWRHTGETLEGVRQRFCRLVGRDEPIGTVIASSFRKVIAMDRGPDFSAPSLRMSCFAPV